MLISCRNEVEETAFNKDSIAAQEDTKIIDPIETQPYPKGGHAGLHRYLAANLKYPSVLRRGEVESKIFVQFIVNENGTISDAEVLRGTTNAELNAHLVEVLNQMPKWTNEAGVKVKYTLPIPFDTE